ncbi:tetratricopeptide repeat protein [Candidatus Protochlamydia phocaeensis]|uniref:tetratricopeptide repeat protein n=1 Tax=Candidatus Protochlamydia phocaeensis TaxID=1414722 RepID=UPI000838E409|nr:tetratricopeptide repeat protein [Candidatus Protochlamydia phocaeensis]
MGRINWLERLGWTEEHIEDLRYTGYAYIRQGKYDIALAFFEALNVLDPESAYDAQTLGAIYLQLNEPAKALKCFDKALKLETDHGPTLLNLTKAFFMLGKKEEALKLAHILKNESNPAIANVAKALILAYS